MSQTFKIRKGHDIKLVGGAPKTDLGRITASTYAVTPSDFPGITPKLVVKQEHKSKQVILYSSIKIDLK